MEKQNRPGLWIAAALAAVFVALFVLLAKKPVPVVEGTKGNRETQETQETQATKETPSETPQPKVPAVSSVPSVAQIPQVPPKPADPDDLPPPPKPITPADRENTLRVIDNVQFALGAYRTALGENPVGTNAEITSALLGNNRKQAKVPVPDGATVNASGELCDPWGTPYFFHQISGTKMEIRSAGPDQKLWSPDDVMM